MAIKAINYRKQIAQGDRKPSMPAPTKTPKSMACGGAVDKTQYQNYGGGFRKVKAK